MTTPPDFSVGQVLTAAHMNAVGLWLVKEQTVGTAVSSVTVTDAFSADYDNYRIIYTGGTGSAAGAGINLQLGASATNYFNVLSYASYATGAYASLINNNTLGYFYYAGNTDSTWYAYLDCDIYEPQKARATRLVGRFAQFDAGGAVTGIHRVNTAYTDFTLSLTAGTLTGGTIRVYGYRN